MPKFPEEFLEKTDKNGPIPDHCPELGPCWIWLGSKAGRYGRFSHLGRSEYSHRFSFKISHKDPIGYLVCHRCDNTLCCNPEHLFIGTHKDNTRDMFLKGREGGKGAPGEANQGSVLTEPEVIDIRRRFSAGETRDSLMANLKISRGSLNKILRRLTWRHI